MVWDMPKTNKKNPSLHVTALGRENPPPLSTAAIATTARWRAAPRCDVRSKPVEGTSTGYNPYKWPKITGVTGILTSVSDEWSYGPLVKTGRFAPLCMKNGASTESFNKNKGLSAP